MEDIIDCMMGIDKRKEIFTLWYEITFLRMVMNKIMEFNPDLHTKMTEEVYEEVRKRSQDIVNERFPSVGLDFSNRIKKQEPNSTTQEDESKRKAEEALRSFRTGWNKHPDDIILDQKAAPSYIPQDHQ